MTAIKVKSHNDLDGVAPGILAKLAFGDQVEVTYHSYDDIDRAVTSHLEKGVNGDAQLFITDISVDAGNEQLLQKHFEEGKYIKLIDHHKTAVHLNKYEWATVISEYPSLKKTAATSLFYEFLVNEGLLVKSAALDEFVELVRQYDTWEWEANENKKAKRLNDLFYIIGLSEFEEKMLFRLKNQNESFEFDETEQVILEIEEEKIERFIQRKQKQIKRIEVGQYVAGLVYSEQYHSELGNILGLQNPQFDLIIIVNIGANKVSYRTRYDDVDVSDFAKVYGGGGHPKAAGSALTDRAFRDFTIAAYGIQPLKSDPEKNRYNVKNSKFLTIYQNEKEQNFWIVPENGKWIVTKYGTNRKEEFDTFEEAELNVKREEAAWLAKDEVIIASIQNKLQISSNKIRSQFEQVMTELQRQGL